MRCLLRETLIEPKLRWAYEDVSIIYTALHYIQHCLPVFWKTLICVLSWQDSHAIAGVHLYRWRLVHPRKDQKRGKKYHWAQSHYKGYWPKLVCWPPTISHAIPPTILILSEPHRRVILAWKASCASYGKAMWRNLFRCYLEMIRHSRCFFLDVWQEKMLSVMWTRRRG